MNSSIIMTQIILLSILGILSIFLLLMLISYITNKNAPFISNFIKKKYLKTKFKLWDDIKNIEEVLPLTKGEIKKGLLKLKYSLHRLEINILYYLALIFKSPKDSFALINCDKKKEECTDEAFKIHKQKQHKITIFSLYAVLILITANITTGMLVSFVFPEIFKIKAETYTETDWSGGTASSTLDLTTSAGDILLAVDQEAGWDIRWGDGGTQLSTAKVNGQAISNIISDGDNGAIVVYEYDSNNDIYAQRVNSDGEAQWTAGGVVISDATGEQTYPCIVSDGADGAIIAWMDKEDNHIYAQRINSDGSVHDDWVAGGIQISTTTASFQWNDNIKMISDEEGGAFIIWTNNDYVNNGFHNSAYIQKINGSGVAQWSSGGEIYRTTLGANNIAIGGKKSLVVYDDGGLSGVIVYVMDEFSGSFIYKINSLGVAQWEVSGVVGIRMTTDDNNGVFVLDGINPAQVTHIDTDGTQWVTPYGDADDRYGHITSDGNGNALFVMQRRNDVAGTSTIVAQKIDSLGNTLWSGHGTELSTTTTDAILTDSLFIYHDNTVGTWVSWTIQSGTEGYVQNLNASGVAQLVSGGMLFTSSNIDFLNGSRIVPTANGAILNFYDSVPQSYVQKITYLSADQYNTSGVYTSPTLDASSTATWNTLTPTATTPASTSISYETRTIAADVTTNKALTGSATASSEIDPAAAGGVTYAAIEANNDVWFADDTTDSWLSGVAASVESPQWLKIDLGATTTVGYIEMNSWAHPASPTTYFFPTGYSIQVMGTSGWQDAVGATTTVNSTTKKTYSFTPVQTREVKLVITEDNPTVLPVFGLAVTAIDEFEIYEADSATTLGTSWEAVSGTTIASADGRYIQYRATLSTTDTSVTPTLSSVTLDYTPSAGGDSTAPVISDVLTSATTTSGITITWTTDEDADSKVSYGTSTSVYDYATTSASLSTSHSMALTGLDDQTTYYFVVTSADASTNTSTSSEYYFTTLDGTAPAISSISSSNITTNSAVITWTTDEASDSKAVYGATSGSLTSSESSTATTTSHSISLSSLSVSTLYYYQVVSIDDSGNSATSSEYTFSTIDIQASGGSLGLGSGDVPAVTPTCGDNNLDEGEECDDGNTEDGDGCSSVCVIEIDEGEETPEVPVTPTEPETPQEPEVPEIPETPTTPVEEIVEPTEPETPAEEGEEPTEESEDITTPEEIVEGEESIAPTESETPSTPTESIVPTSGEYPLDITPSITSSVWGDFTLVLSGLGNSVPAQAVRESVQKIVEVVKEKTKFITEGPEFIAAKKAVNDVADTPEATITGGAVAVTYAVASITQIAIGVGSINNIPHIFINLFGVLFYRRSRKKRQGTVYNIHTGEPVSFARVSILDKGGKVKDVKVTDKYGTYFFLVPKGEYTIQAIKKGYELITEEDSKKADTLYHPPYSQGETLKYTKEDMVNMAIPLEQKHVSKLNELFSKSNVYVAMTILFYLGLIISIVLTIFNPNVYNAIAAVVYLTLYLVRVANFSKPKWGTVSSSDGILQPFSLINVFSINDNNNPVARTIADQYARYALILDKGKYLVKAQTTKGKTIQDTLEVKKRRVVGKNLKM